MSRGDFPAETFANVPMSVECDRATQQNTAHKCDRYPKIPTHWQRTENSR